MGSISEEYGVDQATAGSAQSERRPFLCPECGAAVQAD